MKCQRCGIDRILFVEGKTSDMCFVKLMGPEFQRDGYVPDDLNIGGGDYLTIKFCLECGQIQGDWPVSDDALPRELKP